MKEMGIDPAFRQSVDKSALKANQPIVAFDFDGTLTIRDSFTAFLKWRAGPMGWVKGLAAMTPDILTYLGDRDRGRIKAASVKRFLGGVSHQTLEAEAKAFADDVWDRFMRPDALTCWNDWGARGAHRVIVTASPAETVAPFARRLKADALLGTALAFDPDGRITGAFTGPNCRGEEKVRRLRAAYGEDVTITAAYGDTSGDAEMLAMAETAGFRVFKGRP